jgi:hypothetical protein
MANPSQRQVGRVRSRALKGEWTPKFWWKFQAQEIQIYEKTEKYT